MSEFTSIIFAADDRSLQMFAEYMVAAWVVGVMLGSLLT
jgi:hypothetical protein